MPDVIRLFDSSGTTAVDSVSVDYEDSFCLDSFNELIQAHYTCEPNGSRSFIIARVQSWDLKQPGKAFYSYYSAYHLNKILFQTQVYLGKKLIHRLHVLNPLTNTDIIGDVQYYMLRIPVPEGAVPNGDQEVAGAKKKDVDEQPSIIATAVAHDDKTNADVSLARRGGSTRPSTAPNRESRIADKVPSIITSNSPNTSPNRHMFNLPPPSPSVREAEANRMASWTLVGPLVSEISEEEPTGSGPLRRKFSLALMKMANPYPRVPAPAGPRSALPMLETEPGSGEFILAIPPSPTKSPTKSIASSPTGGGLAEIKIITKPPSGMLMLNGTRRTQRVNIPAGTVTRFGHSVDPSSIPEPQPIVRRRSFSAHDSKTSQPWEQRQLLSDPMSKTPTITASSSSATLAQPSNDQLAFEAVLFATDSDYLESSKTRAVFRANAVIPEDVKLFEMPEYTGVESPIPYIVVDDSPLCEWCFPTAESLSNMTPLARLIHRSKIWLCILALGGILTYLVVRMAKPKLGSSVPSAGYGNRLTWKDKRVLDERWIVLQSRLGFPKLAGARASLLNI
ncbi:hypothetical protein HDU87_007531 [Geranomyces variabilis]|uniref:Uncharacterized protein n=1 Tax=Geranomyces variabilis TaxID=109894 RepID=A0AAD5XTQ1_9FUNG|nr:hypothetical protein HDU87_007531 [Geranomyces variabilis]